MRIPGIPGSSEPSFRTRDAQWLGLDTMVRETVVELAEQGLTLSPYVVKATVQVGRMAVQGPCGRDVDALVESVQMHLRDRRVLISADHIAKFFEDCGLENV